ncbi:MAG: vWA domain-containing protein [Candidatus Ranarchaeia archaeon]
MKYNADITVVLDRSGSMSVIRYDTIGGFNTFLKDQKKEEGTAKLTLVQFDDKYDVVYNNLILEETKELDGQSYVPRGSTALLDAIGRTINDTGARLAALPESERPEEVIFVIITDGEENASHEFTNKKQVFDMIKHQTDKYGWEFLYLGANQDAIKEAASYGIKGTHSMGYAHSGQGITRSFDSISRSVKCHRKSQKLGARFTSKERKDAAED